MGMFWGVGGILSCALPVFNTLCSLTNTMVAIDKTEVSIFWVPEPQVHTTHIYIYVHICVYCKNIVLAYEIEKKD